jgi:hypothetical protein
VKPLAARPRTRRQREYSAVGVQQRALGILLAEADSGEHGLRLVCVVRRPRGSVRRTRVIDSALGRYRGNGNAEPEEEGFGDLVAAPVRYFS